MFKDENLSAMELVDSAEPKECILAYSFKSFGDWARLYYKPREDAQTGFTAYLIELQEATEEEDWHYSNNGNTYHVLLKVIAHFDGIRHWEWSPIEDAQGYLHYTKPEVLGQVMAELAGLVQEYCTKEAL